MIDPPKNHDDLPHEVSKHYYMQYAEMLGKSFKHDDYSVMANWIITNIYVNRDIPEVRMAVLGIARGTLGE